MALAEWGPPGFDESQDHTSLEVLPFFHVDGAGSLNHGLLLLFLSYGT